MIDLTQCPECGQLVRVPRASGPCRFRCPECEAEFDDSVLDETQVPELIPLTEDGEPTLSNIEDNFEDTQRMPHVVTDAQIETGLPDELAEARHLRPTRGRRPKRKVSWELVKIALGGIAGLIIAQLILWWLPGKWRRDPFGLAPQMPTTLHFVLPAELRPRPAVNRDSSVRADSPLQDSPSPDQTSSLVDLPILPDAALPEYQPSYSASELQSVLVDFVTLLQDQTAIDPQDREAHRARLRQIYQELCDVAQIVTFVNQRDPDVDELMRKTETLLTRVSSSRDLTRLVGGAAAQWIRLTSRNSDGVALAGKVVDIEEIGNRYNVQIQLPGRNGPIVHVVRDTDPALDTRQAFHVGDQIIVLGSILSEPQARWSRIQYGVHLVIRSRS